MIDLRFVPLTQWPGEATKHRKDSQFRATYQQTLTLLEDELNKIGAKEITVQAFFRMDQIRNDGWPYGKANPSAPGIILSFKTRDGALSFPCDRYHTLDDNLRAIALSLQALRAVDRYGVTKRAEQYAGWKRIEAPQAAGFASKEDAALFMAREAGFATTANDIRILITDNSLRRMAYRDAAKRLHPESTHPSANKTPGMWDKLQQALSLLETTNL